MNFTLNYRTQLIEMIGRIDLTKVDEAVELFRQARDRGKHIFCMRQRRKCVYRVALCL